MPVVSSLGMMRVQTCLHDLGFLETEALPALNRTWPTVSLYSRHHWQNTVLHWPNEFPKARGASVMVSLWGDHTGEGLKKQHHRETALGHLPTPEGCSKCRGTTRVPPDDNNLKEKAGNSGQVLWSCLDFLSASVQEFSRNQVTISWRPPRLERWTRNVVLFTY